MNCFSYCFGSKEDSESSNLVGIIPRKTSSCRRLSNAERIFRGATVLSHVDEKQKSSNTTTILDKPLKRLGTTHSIYKQSMTPIEEDKGSNESPRKRKAHWVAKDKIHCYFCGGEKCKHENWKNHDNPAIAGLHSDYITEEIIASQRPSTVLIERYGLINVFRDIRVGLIVNVQREGEHPYCGPNKGLEESSGFTYDPHVFISEDIKVRQTGWKDMSVPDSMNFMLDIVKEMAVTIYEHANRVLVHCHAGYGRTGVVIACFIIYVTNKPVDEIVEFIREKRPGCIQKTSQFNFCRKFKMYIDNCRPVFADKNSIEFYMKNQCDLLFGEDLKKFEFVPRLISIVLEKILDMHDRGNITQEEIYKGLFYPESWSEENENLLMYLKQQINIYNWDVMIEDIDIKVLAQLLYDWLEDCVFHIFNPDKIFTIFEEKGLSFLIQEHIKNYKEFSKSNRKSLSDNVKGSLRGIESETLCCVAHFITKIRPTDDDDKRVQEEFLQVARRLCASLLGFSTKNIKDDEEIEKILDYSIRLYNLITFFGIILEHDVEEEVVVPKTISTYVNRRKATETVPKITLSRHDSDNRFTSSINNDTPLDKSSNTIYNNNNKIKININNTYNVNDYAMFEVFKLLESHFKKESSNTSFEEFMVMKDGDHELINKLKNVFNNDSGGLGSGIGMGLNNLNNLNNLTGFSNNALNIPGAIESNFHIHNKRASQFSFGGNLLRESAMVKLNLMEKLQSVEDDNREYNKGNIGGREGRNSILGKIMGNTTKPKNVNAPNKRNTPIRSNFYQPEKKTDRSIEYLDTRNSNKMPILNLLQRVSHEGQKHNSIQNQKNYCDIEDMLDQLRDKKRTSEDRQDTSNNELLDNSALLNNKSMFI
jgi:hypothetical protein